MALEAKQVTLFIRKVLRSSIRICYRCTSEHPVLFSLGILLYLLYRSSPGFFALLLSSSPVIICTTLLLGILLSYGDTNLPEAEDDDKDTPELSALKVGASSSDSHLEADKRFSVPEFRENRVNFKERETKETGFGREKASEHVDLDDDVPLLRRVEEEDERVDRHSRPDKTLTPCPSMVNFHQKDVMGLKLNSNQERESIDSFVMKDKADKRTSLFEDVLLNVNEKRTTFGMFSPSECVKKDVEMEEKLYQERTFTDSVDNKAIEVSEEKQAAGVAGTTTPVCAVSLCQREKLAGLKIETSTGVEDDKLHSSLGSPWARVDSHDDSSGFDSDRAESSSPDASMTDIAPVLDEIDPLLGADSNRPEPIHKDDSGCDSHISSEDPQIDDDSNDEADNTEAKDNCEEKKDDGKEAAFIWTADDEKNLMDLGYSEMERNRRLEILMARRRSRKNIRFEIDKDSIDLNNNDAGRSVDDLSRFRLQVAPISVPRRNPFDLPYDSEEAALPGSAPSILQPQKNPFDLPLEQSNGTAVPACDNLSPQELLTAAHRDMFFKRHESFNLGRTDATHNKRFSRFKPYFVPETVDSEEGSTTNFQRQFSDKSDSKLSAVTESDIASSIADQEDHKDITEKNLHREHEPPMLVRQDSDLADVGSECSDGINSVDVELDNSDIDDREIPLQHFVFERSQEREAYLASMKGKGHEEDYILKASGSSMQPLHAVPDLLSWEDGDSESSFDAKSSVKPNTAVEFSEWVSSPRPAEDTEVGSSSNTIVLGASRPAEEDRSVDFTPYSNNAIHGSMESPLEFGKEDFPVISRDLHPIPEERVIENFNMQEKHETAIFPDSATGLAVLHVIEKHFDVESEGSPAVVSLSPAQEGDAIRSPPVEPAEVSNPFIFTAEEPEKADIVVKKEETTVGYLLDSDEEADKIYPEPIEDNGIDEHFLSELDAVGDFRVEPMRLDQQVSDLGLQADNPVNGVAENPLISHQAAGNISLNMSEHSVEDFAEQTPLINDPKGTDLEFGWSFGAFHDDPEQTVYNPRRRILETSPFEATNTELKPRCDETNVPSVDAPSAASLAVGSSELGFIKNESISRNTNVEMVILDAQSLEDIETAFKQVSDGDVNEPTPDNEASQVSRVGMDSEPSEGARLLHVVDAKSVDDMHAGFQELSGGVVNSSSEENKAKDECGEAAECIEHDKLPAGVDTETLYVLGGGKESEPLETIGNMSIIEAKRLDDIDEVFKKFIDTETAFKKVSDGVVNEPTLDNETSQVSGIGTDLEPADGARQLHVVDAKSVDDIHAAFQKLSGGTVNDSLEEKEANDECGEAAKCTEHDNLPAGTDNETVHDGKESAPLETTDNMSVIVAKPLDDIDEVFKKLSDGSAGSTAQVMESDNAC